MQRHLEEAQAAVTAEIARRKRNKIATYFPPDGPLARRHYPKHMAFFRAGASHEPMVSCPKDCDGSPHRERCFMAGNRVGKTDAGAFETTLHLTGQYPAWWRGRRFREPVQAWACGDTNKTVREVVQTKLYGTIAEPGTGFIPGDLITHRTTKQGIAESLDTIYVKHVSGGTSRVTLKSYQEGRESFQGSSVPWIWLDEEPGEAIYTEALMRTMDCNGSLILTFTPLLGLSSVVLSFLPDGLPAAE